jgi:hypothetical protein
VLAGLHRRFEVSRPKRGRRRKYNDVDIFAIEQLPVCVPADEPTVFPNLNLIFAQFFAQVIMREIQVVLKQVRHRDELDARTGIHAVFRGASAAPASFTPATDQTNAQHIAARRVHMGNRTKGG